MGTHFFVIDLNTSYANIPPRDAAIGGKIQSQVNTNLSAIPIA